MLWIKMYDNLPEHPKVFRLMAMTGWDEDQAIGKLFKFWRWVAKYAEDGDLRRFMSGEIEASVGYKKKGTTLVEIFVKCGFVDVEPYLRVHDWYDSAGAYLRKKYAGTDNDDKPDLVKQLYKSKKFNRSGNRSGSRSGNSPGTVLEQVPRLALPRLEERSEKTLRLSARAIEVKGRKKELDAHERRVLELKAFIRKNVPAGFENVAESIDDPDQREALAFVLGRLGADQEVKAAWSVFVTDGSSSYEWARNQKFCMQEFMRQLPHLVDNPSYSTFKKKFFHDDTSAVVRSIPAGQPEE